MLALAHLFRRIIQLVPLVLGVTMVTFFLIHLVPGDPARTLLGTHATDRAVAEMDRQLGLNKSIPQQYVLFMTRLSHGNLGESVLFNEPVSQLVRARLPVTLWLIGFAAVLSLLIAVPVATIAAIRRGKIFDHAVRAASIVGLGMPSFWVGLMLVLLFAIRVHVFPVSGYGSGFTGHLRSMFLPSMAIALGLAPILIRNLRARLLEVLDSEYIVTARAKGLSPFRVIVRHALRNSVLSLINVLALQIGFLVGGTVVIENIFALPGLGQVMVTGIFNRDFAVVQGITLIFALMIVLVYLVADLLYGVFDPRVRRAL